ncbi:MAG: hypothetical protein IKE52_01265 [Mogibacterium sp.]|nr:hypothetical protein [Mogibacterium sp.]
MYRKIDIQKSKSLRLDNVLMKDIINITEADTGVQEEDDFSLGFEVEKMDNEIRTKGANQIGPLIQYSGASGDGDALAIKVTLMLQADRYINNIRAPYRMESVVQAKNCMYTRFTGAEEDIQYAYQKMQVTAYEENIKLKGSSYTIFLDSDDEGNITADIFMEIEK